MANSPKKESSALEKANRRAEEELRGFDRAVEVLKELRQDSSQCLDNQPKRRKVAAS